MIVFMEIRIDIPVFSMIHPAEKSKSHVAANHEKIGRDLFQARASAAIFSGTPTKVKRRRMRRVIVSVYKYKID